MVSIPLGVERFRVFSPLGLGFRLWGSRLFLGGSDSHTRTRQAWLRTELGDLGFSGSGLRVWVQGFRAQLASGGLSGKDSNGLGL